MTMRMLIDARHPEETRVAVVKGTRIEEFDFESEEHKQLKGNIYLAKVTRVEPSLQAAFIDYGGNRHGFLAFSEIHPDYYQIPKSDRDALLREEAEHAAEEERLRAAEYDAHGDDDADHHDDDYDDHFDVPEHSDDDDPDPQDGPVGDDTAEPAKRPPADESAADELRRKRQNLRRRYKIQDVIQRRQVLLVQVVKEERGNKGAALTTYLSLAGRYCVLMPNTSAGGGISRKISTGADRKRLKSIMSDLNLPKSMGLIVRTAGLSRTKTEIKRDFDYLARLWDEIRENTLGSSAPALVYRDSDLVKRAIRDLYHREIDEVVVEGEDGYKAARGYMKLLMPSHVRRVKLHDSSTALFQQNGVEDQLSAMYQPVVQLKSGGYLVINPTEALVSIDINSGRATREHNIEQTAFATNIEAAAEIARQLRLRDMAGLVVIDFIDMEQSGHIRKVEKVMKDALKNDRARIQVGRISSFGLLEMSRQRLRTGVLEASTKTCAHCEGTGLMRTASSAGLSALRIIEDEAARGRGDHIMLRAGREAAIYVLNRKRSELGEIETRYGVTLDIVIEEALEGARMSVESSGPRPIAPVRAIAAPMVDDDNDLDVDDMDEVDDVDSDVEDDRDDRDDRDDQPDRDDRGPRSDEPRDEDGVRRRRRRRRGGRGRNRRDEGGEGGEGSPEAEREDGYASGADDAADGEKVDDEVRGEADRLQHATPDSGEDGEAPRPRRGRRGGRGRGRRSDGGSDSGSDVPMAEQSDAVGPDSAPMAETTPSFEQPITALEPSEEDTRPGTRRRPRARKPNAVDAPVAASPTEQPVSVAPVAAPVDGEADGEADAKPKRRSRAKPKTDAVAEAEVAEAEVAEAEVAEVAEVEAAVAKVPAARKEPAQRASAPSADNDLVEDDSSPDKPRNGWWQRTFG